MLLRPALLVLALTISTVAWGTPERVVRLTYVEGQVAFQGVQETARHELPDRPLIPGDRLTTERGGRAELSLGTATIRLDEQTEFSIVDLDATTVLIQLNEGTASIVLHDLSEDETFEIDTPNTAIALEEPGDYRLEVSADGATALTVRSGTAEVGTPAGQVRVAEGQHVRFEGRDAFASLTAPAPEDAFDAWVLTREQALTDAESRYADRNSGEQLDRYGEWYDEPNYGRVWMPSYAYGGHDPFRYGHWQRVGFGWSWFDSAPWGFFTFHSGRWAYLQHRNRWCWVPEREHHTPRIAQDTRPFGRPREDARPRGDRRDATPMVPSRRDDGERRPVATTTEHPWRIDADRRPMPSTKHNESAPKRSEPARQSGTTTMRPSRPTESRSQALSRPPPSSKPSFVPQPVP